MDGVEPAEAARPAAPSRRQRLAVEVIVTELDEPIVVDDGVRYAPTPPDFREQVYEPTLATHGCVVRRKDGWTTVSVGRDAWDARQRSLFHNRHSWPGPT